MTHIAVLDTSIGSTNLGDQIIMEAVERELASMFPGDLLVKLPTHVPYGREGVELIRASKHCFVGGTNLLSSDFLKYRQWRFSGWDLLRGGNAILMGVGWWQYQDAPTAVTRWALSRLLSREFQHSVRDGYSAAKLGGCGFPNHANTGCPSLWALSPEACAAIPIARAPAVVVTLTDYAPVPERDRHVLETARDHYQDRYFWPQGSRDLEYLRTFGSLASSFKMLEPRLDSFDTLLSSGSDCEYIGTRLHGGIRALQHGRKTLVIGIDNRALELARDWSIPVLPQAELVGLAARLRAAEPIRLRVPTSAIQGWRAQFTAGR